MAYTYILHCTSNTIKNEFMKENSLLSGDYIRISKN